MGDQGLARPRLPINQNVTVRLPQIQNIFAQTLHHRRFADQLLHQLPAIAQLTAQGPVVHGQTARAGGLLGQFGHAVGVERLFQKIERAHAHRLDRHGHIAVTCNHDHRQGAVIAHQLFQKLHPVHAGHLDVGNDNAGIFGAEVFQRILRTGKGFGVIARQGQPLADGLAHVLFIIDNGDLHGLGHRFSPGLFRRLGLGVRVLGEDRKLHFKDGTACLSVSRGEPSTQIVHNAR
mmetsp:Transcript_18163/g.28379  ORF Transcript_18163/g.28379 Transcript_18163/m.28379 type:complete len:234 (-) Transcript_18163:2625-3326(-)